MKIYVVSAGDLMLMTRGTFDEVIRALEGAGIEISIEQADKRVNDNFNRAVAFAAAADPDARVHDLLKQSLEEGNR